MSLEEQITANIKEVERLDALYIPLRIKLYDRTITDQELRQFQSIGRQLKDALIEQEGLQIQATRLVEQLMRY